MIEGVGAEDHIVQKNQQRQDERDRADQIDHQCLRRRSQQIDRLFQDFDGWQLALHAPIRRNRTGFSPASRLNNKKSARREGIRRRRDRPANVGEAGGGFIGLFGRYTVGAHHAAKMLDDAFAAVEIASSQDIGPRLRGWGDASSADRLVAYVARHTHHLDSLCRSKYAVANPITAAAILHPAAISPCTRSNAGPLVAGMGAGRPCWPAS